MTTLYLVRHGQTEDNVAQIMQGQTHGRLTGEGVRQAEALALRMAGENIAAFVSSDLQRAVDTCRIVAEPHGLPVTTTPLLRERDWGGFTGRHIPSLQGLPWPDDIETAGEMLARAGLFLEWIKESFQGKTVLAVGHGIINKAVQSAYHSKPMHEIPRMDNAEVRTLIL